MVKAVTITGVLLEDDAELTLADLCRACSVHAEWLMELVDEGVLDPVGADPLHWRFGPDSLRRARTACRLRRDLGINLAGAALALDLLEEIDDLRSRLALIDRNTGP